MTDTRFDDRLDVESKITNLDTIRLLGRSLKLIKSVKGLFAAKIILGILALIPSLYVTWLPKIIVDQVILGRPFDETEVPFPPHLTPFVNLIRDFGPMEIMIAVTALLVFLLFIFGRDGLWVGLAEGEDSATQAENAMNRGGSSAAGLVGVADALAETRMSQRLTNTLRTKLYQRMTRLPMTTLDDHRIGDAIYRVMYDAPMVPGMCYHISIRPIFMLIGAAISLYLMNYSYGRVAPELVWICASMIPISLLITLPFSGVARRVQQNSRAAGAATTNAIEESFSNITAVQSLGGMAQEKERIAKHSDESFRRFRHIRILQIGITLALAIVLVVIAFHITILITDNIIAGIMSPGDFWVAFGLAITLAFTAQGIGSFWIELQGNAAAVRRVFFFIDQPSEDSGVLLPALSPISEGIRIENGEFHYPGGPNVLRNINIDLSLGELVAIVGPTGAGKTSLAYLIPGFLRPTQGRVLIDGQDILEIDVDSLRDQVTYVFQEHLLLSETIRENLQLVNPDATDTELWAALEDAGARTFVEALPDGIDTPLGRSGDTLSVGQKQRLSIARGLVRNTPILILDEPTAALDPQTENALVQSLIRASQKRLVIVIAHRLSTIRRADRIIFLEDGEIRDIGNHEALMAKPESRYRHFVELQSG